MDDETTEKMAAIYARLRSYIEHEDDLIYQRTTLLVTVQSFLIATFGFSYQKKYEIAFDMISNPTTIAGMKQSTHGYDIFLLILCLAGASTAMVTAVAIMCASSVIKRLHDLWRENMKPHVSASVNQAKFTTTNEFPDVIGGGLRFSATGGISLSITLPFLFVALWLSVALFMIITVKWDWLLKLI